MTVQRPRKQGVEWTWTLSLCLAVFVTGLSVYIALEAGDRLGGNHDGQRFVAGCGIVAVLNAHLLTAICRRASAWLRLCAIGISMVSASVAVYIHASVFLSVQSQASVSRVTALDSSAASTTGYGQVPGRATSLILMEVARVKAEQVRLQSMRCADDCSRVDGRYAILTARLAALDAEVDEARRWQRHQDQLELRKATAQDDPVTARVANLLGVNSGAAALIVGLLFAVTLDGTGSLCWFIVLKRLDSVAATSSSTEVTSPAPAVPWVAVTAESVTAVSPIVVPPAMPDDPVRAEARQDQSKLSVTLSGDGGSNHCKVLLLAERVRPEIEAGRVRPTVTGIRQYFACGQRTAALVRRALNVG